MKNLDEIKMFESTLSIHEVIMAMPDEEPTEPTEPGDPGDEDPG